METELEGRLPSAFVEYTRRMMGEELFGRFICGMSEPCPNSLRVNKAKMQDLSQLDTLSSMRQQVPWCDSGYYLAERPNYTFDPLLHAGYYYVQEASSMFVHSVLRQYIDRPVMMLDMCAAPGGKTTAAIGALPEESIVVSNEPVRQRANILAENVQKWGSALHIVTCNYPRDYAKSGLMFDVVLCDVPCSGEGMFRKDEGAISEWSVANVEKCSRLQREIVADAWKCLRPGGILIYSTCTYNIKENEENVRWISEELGADVLPVEIGEGWGITGSLLEGFALPVFRFIPGVSRGEGLFMAVLRKTDDDAAANRRMKPSRLKTAKFEHQWLINQDDYCIYTHKDRYIAVPRQMADIYAVACQSLNVVSAGVTLGEQKGRDIVPHQSLALSTALHTDAFPCVELTYEQAISYLRKETIVLDDGVERGFVIVKYKNAPLGFVKNIGNRANNLYPQEWRIRN
ncbi:MAG: hypothetical protein J1E57_03420 [Prevotella sp.]|nr:hypothetical protein [Prevotella sp.]